MFGNYYLRQWNEAAERAEIAHRKEAARLQKEAQEFAESVFGMLAQEQLKQHPGYGVEGWVAVIKFAGSHEPRYLSKNGFTSNAADALAFQSVVQAINAVDAKFDGKRGNPVIGALKRPVCLERVQAFPLRVA